MLFSLPSPYNSSDYTSASATQLAVSRVRTILERELEKRRASHAHGVGVESLGAEDADTHVGGLEWER